MYQFTVKEPLFNHVFNKDKANRIIEALAKNKGYCPCALIKNEDTICQCLEYRKTKICRCNLYVEI